MYDLIQLINICKTTNKNVFIQTHNFPDSDAIASAYALGEIFQHFNISYKYCCAGQIDRFSTSKLAEYLEIYLYSENELNDIMDEKTYIVCIDSQKNAGNIVDFIGDEIACIDHHPTFVEIEYKWKQVDIVGACSTLLVEHFQNLNLIPSEKCATALLFGIKTDTLNFSRGVTQRDIQAFSYLFDKIDNIALNQLSNSKLVSKDLLAYSSAIENIHLYGDVGFSKVPFSCPDGLIATISDFILSLEEVNIAIVYCIREDGIKFSTRSVLPNVNAGTITHNALKNIGSGGGHASMAGGFIPIENFGILSPYMDNSIENIFISALKKCIE